jgi:hypothetical protein
VSTVSTTERAAHELVGALETLRGALASEAALREFVRGDLGFDVPEALRSLGIDGGSLDAMIAALDALGEARDGDGDGTIALRSAELAAAVAVAAAGLAAAGPDPAEGLDPAFATASRFDELLPRRLLDWLLVTQIDNSSGVALEALRTLGIAEVEPVEADPATFTTEHVRKAIALDPLVALVNDPARWLELAYGWGTDRSSLARLPERLFTLAVACGFPARLGRSDLLRVQALAGAGAFDPEQDDAPPELRIPFLSPETTHAALDAGLDLVVLPARNGVGEGLALVPFAEGGLDAQIELDRLGAWLLGVDGTFDLQAGVGIVARPGQGLRAVTDIDGTGGAAAGSFEARLTRADTADAVPLLSFAGGSGLFVTGFELRAAALLAASEDAELLLEAGVKAASLRVRMGEADGFLRSVVPDLDVTFDAALGVSTRRGTYFRGGAGLELATALNRQLGPVQLRRLRLALRPPAEDEAPGVELVGGVELALAIGPMTAVVDGIGARVRISEQSGGNLGPLELDAGFKPPDGIALELAAGPVRGGGFLHFDEVRAEYAGAMALELGGIAVRAVGLLTTRMPGGAPGFSLLVIVSAEFAPVQLGLGFSLVGVGGLLGINRTIAVDELRAGFRSGSIGAILSPPDPAGNAAQLVPTLSRLFPPAAGRHVIGPLARIVWGSGPRWGSPALMTIELCLALELPAPVRLLVLGRLRAVLPDEEAAVARLQMDLLGVIEFTRCEAAVDARLVDSRLAQFPLTGSMAMRLSWGPRPSLLLAVGGFHPRFAAPEGFPVQDRVSFALSSGDNPRLRLELYLAVTSNTIQLGARVDLFARAGGFSIEGFLSFDALVRRKPFAFDVDIAAKLAVRAGGRVLLSVSLALILSGPEPWRARGRASFSILFIDVSVGFDVTCGSEPPPELPERVDVGPLLLAALGDPRAWDAQLPAGGETFVTLRAVARGAEVLAHPLGTLQVRQRVAPLDRTLERFGTAEPAGARRFSIASVLLGEQSAETHALEDQFAPAQFRDLSDDEKLSLPSFESMPSGVRIGEEDIAHGEPVDVEVVYEQNVTPGAGDVGSVPAGDAEESLTQLAPPARPPAFALRETREGVLQS